jgi:hypothetical protein
MTNLICALIDLWKVVFGPRPQGRHRADRATAVPQLLAPPIPPAPPAWPRSPRPRSPYGLGLDEPLNGHETALVRPYLVAHEERERQWERRLALLLALHGVDVGPDVIHGVRVGVGAAA